VTVLHSITARKASIWRILISFVSITLDYSGPKNRHLTAFIAGDKL
jgi:hypothetical protein